MHSYNTAIIWILSGDDLDYLDGEHCVFGEVVEGLDIVDKINLTICDKDNRPYQVINTFNYWLCYNNYFANKLLFS